MQYKIKHMTIQIGGKVYRKSDGRIFNTETIDLPIKSELEAAAKAGFVEEINYFEEKPKLKIKKSGVTGENKD